VVNVQHSESPGLIGIEKAEPAQAGRQCKLAGSLMLKGRPDSSPLLNAGGEN
jgi:hypothetical protein